MAEIIKLGCLQLDRQPKGLGVKYNGEVLSFGDTDPVKAIPFVKWRNLLVAARCVCTYISWNDLNHLGYIFGHPVKIDGAPYLCRSLKAGEERDVPNEWDSILDDLGEDDGLWHWSDGYFWGQETSRRFASSRAVRGYYSARYWDYNTAAYRNVYVGFRPVLEPLPPEPLVSDTLIGANLKVYGPDTAIIGQLVEYTDYDLVIELSAQQPSPMERKWAGKDGKHIIIDRSAIVWVQETN